MTTADITRLVSFELRAAGDDGPGTNAEGRSLAGYAAVFGEPTTINSWEGTFTESIRRGAFKKSIRERTPVLQFDHGRHPLVGSIPIGSITELAEDDRGLYVEAELADNWLMQPVADAIRSGSISGMSFRFGVVREEWTDAQGKRITDPDELARLLWDAGDRGPLHRELVEVKVAELGPVVFPAYAATSVSVRAASLAGQVLADAALAREARSALALGGERGAPGDPALSVEVARAVLFGATRTAPPPAAPAVEERDDTPQAPEATPAPERATEPPAAPPTTGHPAGTDAPPTTGHPSLTPAAARAAYARAAYVTRHRVGKRTWNA